MGTNIINWNCRGFKKNIDEIKMILKDYDPVVLCCQETYTKTNNTIDFRKYVSYHTHAEAIDGRACGGVSVMVKKTIPHRQRGAPRAGSTSRTLGNVMTSGRGHNS